MNLNNNPTLDELRVIFAAADDAAGHHALWIDTAGDVHLSMIPPELTPLGFEQVTPSMKVRCETYTAGGGYVGPAAAADNKFMGDTFRRLVNSWAPPFPVGRAKYVDY